MGRDTSRRSVEHGPAVILTARLAVPARMIDWGLPHPSGSVGRSRAPRDSRKSSRTLQDRPSRSHPVKLVEASAYAEGYLVARDWTWDVPSSRKAVARHAQQGDKTWPRTRSPRPTPRPHLRDSRNWASHPSVRRREAMGIPSLRGWPEPNALRLRRVRT